MKRSLIFGFLFLFMVLTFGGVYAESCDLQVSLVNQDSYPAIPGEYVKLVFQIDGINNPLCGTVDFELLEKYPLIFDAGQQKIYEFESGVFQRNYESFFLASYKIKVDEDALDGDIPIEVRYKTKYKASNSEEIKRFNLNVKDTRADFEVYVKNYLAITNDLTFEILNIADVNVKALTIEIPKQKNIVVKGSNRNIVGDLDSNEYTTASFEAIPKSGEIKLKIFYSDYINERRFIEKTILFEPEYFEGRIGDKSSGSVGIWIFIILIFLGIVYWFHRKKKIKNKKN